MTSKDIMEFIEQGKPDDKLVIYRKDLITFAKDLVTFCYEDCKRMVSEELGKYFSEQSNDSKAVR